MKKLIILVAVVFTSFTVFSQSYFQQNVYNNSTAENVNKTSVNIISNPAKGAINVRLSNPSSTKYDMSLYTLNGQKVTSISYDHPGGVSTKSIYVPDGTNGMCYLVIRTNEQQTALKVFVEP